MIPKLLPWHHHHYLFGTGILCLQCHAINWTIQIVHPNLQVMYYTKVAWLNVGWPEGLFSLVWPSFVSYCLKFKTCDWGQISEKSLLMNFHAEEISYNWLGRNLEPPFQEFNNISNWRESLPVLSKSKGIVVHLLAKLANEIADFVLDLCQFSFGLLGNLNNIKLRIYITFTRRQREREKKALVKVGIEQVFIITFFDLRNLFTRFQFSDHCSRHRGCFVVIKIQLPWYFPFGNFCLFPGGNPIFFISDNLLLGWRWCCRLVVLWVPGENLLEVWAFCLKPHCEPLNSFDGDTGSPMTAGPEDWDSSHTSGEHSGWPNGSRSSQPSPCMPCT